MLYKRFAIQFRLLTIILLSVVVSSCGDGDGPTPVVDPTPPAEQVYTLVWADEFDVDGPPNVQNWRMETGYGDNGWGNDEWQLYTDDTSSPNNNVRVENGNLVITARCSEANTDPAKCNSADPVTGALRTGIITSARINTKDKFEIKYGNIQARIKTPPGKGMWPAFWSLGSVFPDTPWPRAGEIDFMEMHQFFSNDRTTHFTVHWCDDSKTAPDQCEFDPGWTFDSRFKTFDEVLTDDYHIFEADWDENRIIGKIDGITYFSRPIDWTTEEEFLKSFFMILNIAVGGTLGGPPNDSTTWPQEMLVDWVRVYEKNKPDVVELVPDDRTEPLPFIRMVNSVEFGGDSVVSTIQRTLSEDDDDFDKITPPAVTPLTGNTVVELDYQSANTFFSGGAFLFKLKDITHYEKLVFSIDTSTFGRLILNGGFGSPEASGSDVLCHTDWDCVNGSYTTASEDIAEGKISAPVSHNPEDNQSIKQFGDGLTFQVVAATPGTTYQASVWAMNWFGNDTTDPFTESGFMELSFLDAGGNVIPGSRQYVYVDAVDDGTDVYLPSQDGADVSDWTELTIEAVAPAGTVSAKMRLKHQLGGGSGGSLRWDDASITATITSGGSVVLSPNFDDISIEMQDDRFNGEGDPGKTSLPLSDYAPVEADGNWQTYEIPLTDFNLTNLDNVELFGFWNPVNAADQRIAGKLYLDDIKFDSVPCTVDGSDKGDLIQGSVSFNPDSYPPNATIAQVKVTDTCLANKNKSVVAVVDNGTDAIGVALTLDAKGEGQAVVNFGSTTEDATSTIAINDGDVLTVTYTDANGVKQSDTAGIGVFPLGVYSETHTFPVIPYFEILNQDTVTNEASTAVAPLEGSVSLQADFSVPTSGSENGLAFNFEFPQALVNGTFETPDASGGDVGGAPGWTTFESVFTNATDGPNFGPVSHDAGGTQSLTMFGPFFFDGASGAYQADDSVEPEQLYTATAHVMNWAPDALAPGNLGIFQLSFWDAPGGADGGGNNLGVTEILVDSTDDGVNVYLPPQDGADISDWTELSITEVAPEGTVSAQVFLLHIQLNEPAVGGKIFWDDVSLSPTAKLNNISLYRTLKFGINTVAASGLMDLEVRMVDAADASSSVFLSNYSPASSSGDWDVYEIPLSDFAGLDLTEVNSLGFFNASTTVTPTVTHFDGVLYFDDVHFVEEEASQVLTGILVNSPIEGVTFETATQSGITNVLGEFRYLAGEMVTFSVGDIILGSVQGAPIITPVELTGSVDPTAQPATNLLVFLQSIDADSIHSNGIKISAFTQAAAVGQNLVFTEPEFSNQIDAVVAAIADPSDPDKSVVDETTALDNFYLTYVEFGGTNTFSWLFPGYPPVPGPDVVETLGVYSETNINPVLTYSEIIDTDTVTNETSMLVVALEGMNSLQADYSLPASGNESGFDFNFGPAGGGSVNLLTNSGFESPDASGGDIYCSTGWTCFNAGNFTNNTAGPSFGPVSHDTPGLQSLKQFGIDAGAFQDVAVTGGTTYEASVWAMNWVGDPLNNLGILQLSFRDAVGNVTGPLFENFVDPIDDGVNIYLPVQDGADISDWTLVTAMGFAPADAVSARLLLLHVLTPPAPGSGTVRWDDASISAATAAVTGADISAYATLKFGINTSATSGLLDLEVKMKTTAGAESSVFLSNYTPTPGAVSGWDVYEIPLVDFDDPAQLDLTDIVYLGFWNPSSTLTGSTTVAPTLLAGTLYFDDIHFVKTATPPTSNTIGVYSETNINPALAYSEIINAADFGGNVTNTNELSTAVSPLDGSFVLQALFLNSSQAFGGFVFNFDTVRPAVNGQDISAYTTLKFGIDTSGIPNFADLVVQLEDGNAVSKVFLSDYTQTVTVSNNWDIYQIPLTAFTGLDLTNLTYLGFWNPSSTMGAESPLVFGPLYFDDIHFTK